ncbi:hypothetical protein CASFOL_004463 [Castilleja foliolosa]|uniref:Uncharacterized protein n=1 Tax=Castilleja foliolosa TaxID=1961234 RepID=A0ABD3EE85_9LAMI
MNSNSGHSIHPRSSCGRVTRDDKVRVSCEKVAEEGGFGGYLRRGIAVAFTRGGSGGCAWPDAADLEEATGLRRGSGRLRNQFRTGLKYIIVAAGIGDDGEHSDARNTLSSNSFFVKVIIPLKLKSSFNSPSDC